MKSEGVFEKAKEIIAGIETGYHSFKIEQYDLYTVTGDFDIVVSYFIGEQSAKIYRRLLFDSELTFRGTCLVQPDGTGFTENQP